MFLRFLSLLLLFSLLQDEVYGARRRGGRRRVKRRRWNVEQSPPPTPAPTSPAPATPAPAAPAPASPAGPAGAGGATVLPAGVPASYPGCNNIKDYPSTPLKVEPFTEAFKQAEIKGKEGTIPGSVPMDVYEFEEVYVANYKLLPESVCPGGTKMLLYDGVFPGKTVVQEVGHQAMSRFINKVDVSKSGPLFGETDRPWGNIGKKLTNMCAERESRIGNPNPGTGRALAVHHHGMGSLAPFDGWAEDVHCYGEAKDYVLPGNFASHFWFHDHTVATTAENTYAGLEASYIVKPCQEPYNLQKVPQYVVHFLDVVMDGQCQMVFDKADAHFDNLWGDVNTINGVAWPVLTVQPRYTRFRILNGAVSRSLQINIEDAAGKRYNDRCRIVGSDGGVIGKDRTGGLGGRAMPSARGLFTANGYRWDVVCDFRGLEGNLYMTNEPNDDLMKPVPPMWCNSHLLMKIEVSATKTPSTPLLGGTEADASQWNDPAYMADYTKVVDTIVDKEIGDAATLAAVQAKANNGKPDRRFKFGKQGDYWVMNENWGWEHNADSQLTAKDADQPQAIRDAEHGSHLVATDVGQNFVELWELESGGGWVHPVHAHLIQWYILAVNGKPVEEEYPELWHVPKDVILIGAGNGDMTMAARYGPSLGRYLFHCHNGVHEDRDMMMAYSVVPPNLAQKTAASTGFDAQVAALFEAAGGDYSNGDLNARFGDRFYPAKVGQAGGAGTPQPQSLEVMAAAAAWNQMGFYTSFYNTDVPNWKFQQC